MKNNKTIKVLCLLLLLVITLSSCGKETVVEENKHTHNYKYGYCQQCGEMDPEEKEVLKVTINAGWSIRLAFLYPDANNDPEVEINSISTDGKKYYVEATASCLYKGKTYYSDIKAELEWNENRGEDDKRHFLLDNVDYSDFRE